MSFDKDREIAALGRAGRRGDALDNLALQHQDHLRNATTLFDEPLEYCRRDVVRQICDDARALRRSYCSTKIERESVGLDKREIIARRETLPKYWHEPAVEFDGDDATTRAMHRTIDAVTRDYPSLGFNTAIARMIEFNNTLTKLDAVPRQAAEALVVMVAPLAPHIAEELWSKLGHEDSITYTSFPVADPALLVEDTVTCVVQIKGKVRDRLEVPADITEDDLRAQVLALPKVVAATEGGIRTVIVRAPKLVNVVPV